MRCPVCGIDQSEPFSKVVEGNLTRASASLYSTLDARERDVADETRDRMQVVVRSMLEGKKMVLPVVVACLTIAWMMVKVMNIESGLSPEDNTTVH